MPPSIAVPSAAAGVSRRALLMLPLALPLGSDALAREAQPPHGAPPAAAWPRRAIHITVAYPPGGVSDQVARALAEVLSGDLGVPVVIENKAGVSGTLALDLLVQRPADGHSLCFVAATAIALRARAAKGRGVALRAAVPVAGVMRTPILIVGTRSLGVDGFARMIEKARQSPGGVRWATTGEGTTGYVVLDRVRRASQTEIVHIPYKGGGQQLLDALAGHFEVLSTNVASAQLEDIAAGRLVALAVGAPKRLKVLPETPTLAELGYDDANLDSLFGLFAPPDLPEARVRRLNLAVATALENPALQSRLRSMSNQPFEGSANAFARQVAREAGR